MLLGLICYIIHVHLIPLQLCVSGSLHEPTPRTACDMVAARVTNRTSSISFTTLSGLLMNFLYAVDPVFLDMLELCAGCATCSRSGVEDQKNSRVLTSIRGVFLCDSPVSSDCTPALLILDAAVVHF